MHPGRLRNLIDCCHPTPGAGDAGGVSPTYQAAYVAGVPAAVEDLSGNQLLAARMAFAEVTTRVEIRFRNGIKPDDRINVTSGYGAGRKLNVIAALDPDNGKGIRLHLMCKELSDGT